MSDLVNTDPRAALNLFRKARESLEEDPFPYEEPIPFVHLYHGGFDGQALIDAFEATGEWRQAMTGGGDKGRVGEHRDSRTISLNIPLNQKSDTLSDVQKAGLPVLYAAERAVWDYRETYDLHLDEQQGWIINKYGHGGNYLPHTDHGPSSPRLLSAVVYLNTISDEGKTFFLEWDWRASCVEGDILLFPSSYPWKHEAEPVGLNDPTQVKYSMVTWFV
tara:strand:- start:688 stop:1344 length:657 start_codon:yes stop_codon:yes gene_type:complete